ncbi:hypothetical protein F0U60_10165 [Archangium minus]|uniref:Uncharacterized protein n=1 Tax=Archangium minus TaxID=83450 RepID=A0ABY9WKR3_9BACT|nr:hypothetical protein F0U60_10165 [Archangium minus]
MQPPPPPSVTPSPPPGTKSTGTCRGPTASNRCAFEESGRIVVDYVRYPDFGINQWLGKLILGQASTDVQGWLHRATLDVNAGTFHSKQVSDRRCEFPSVTPLRAGARHRYTYLLAHSGPDAWRGPQDVLVKMDMETGAETVVPLGAGHYPSEPTWHLGESALRSPLTPSLAP